MTKVKELDETRPYISRYMFIRSMSRFDFAFLNINCSSPSNGIVNDDPYTERFQFSPEEYQLFGDGKSNTLHHTMIGTINDLFNLP